MPRLAKLDAPGVLHQVMGRGDFIDRLAGVVERGEALFPLQPTGVPGLTFLSTVTKEQPLSSTDVSAIPFETIPIILAGFKLATTITCFPTSSSGL